MFVYLQTTSGFDLSLCASMKLIYEQSANSDLEFRVFSSAHGKPVEDTFYQSDEQEFYLFEGVLANSGELVTKFALTDCKSLIIKGLQDDSGQVISQFHGQFCGLRISNAEHKIKLFTNQTNTIRIYYYSSGKIFIAGTSIRLINLLLNANGINTSIDETGARMILTYGYMLEDHSTIREIRQLGAGNCIEHSLAGLQIHSYHRFNHDILHSRLKDVLPVMDELFRKAVACTFDKDNEQGKAHIAFLSGGLDSRQTVMYAYMLGYQDITCLNFCQPGYADASIAREIAKKLGLNLIFYPLTNGDYLLDLDKNLIYNEGQVTLHGAAHLFAGISAQDLSKYGILHSGQVGDAILGSFLQTKAHSEVNLNSKAYSTRLVDSIMPEIKTMLDHYPNQESFLTYNRAFNAATNGDYACALSNYSISPFLHPEFAQYCFNISPELRYNWRAYYAWIRKYNPLGASFTWENTMTNLLTPAWYGHVKQYIYRAADKASRMVLHKPGKRSMNPFELWWTQNPKLRARYSSMPAFEESLSRKLSKNLQQDATTMFATGNFSEKLQVYSLYRGIEYLYRVGD